MNLLYANDAAGEYPTSWYAATAQPLDKFPLLKGETRADVCIIGGGYTGLSAALHLAEMGRDVVLLEAQRIGFGASGRNGGQLGLGQRQDQTVLEAKLGAERARAAWDLSIDAIDLVKSLISKHDIDCDYRPGLAWAATRPSGVEDLHSYAAHLEQSYAYQLETLSAEALRAICPSPAYCGGFVDRNTGHLHPLRFALGLARAAVAAGVRIHEGSEVHQIDHGAKATVRTSAGRVLCDQVILATNGYCAHLDRKVAAHVAPINNFIAATEPLGARTAEVLTQDIAVADEKFVVNYFRLSSDGRLLFGGGESYGRRFPADIAAKVRKPMLEIFPSLSDVRIDYAWGGTLAITVDRMPYLRKLAPNVLSASGYSGHGVGTATHAGKLMALALAGDSDGFDTMAAIPARPFPGGAALQSPLLTLAMTWFSLRDRLGL